MIRRIYIFLGFFFFFGFVPIVSHAQPTPPSSKPMTLYADEMNQKEDRIYLNGNVRASFDTYKLSADKVTISWGDQRILATGHVVLKEKQNHIQADKIDFDYNKKVGEFHNALIRFDQVSFEGKVIRKVGENNYEIMDARFSTCTDCPPLWSVDGQLIEAEIGGYAYIKYPILRVKSIPTLWLPAIWFPIKTERQSGFLVPSIEQGSSLGEAIEVDYFWSISESQDMTLSTKLYTKKRGKGLLEYRHVFDENGRGQFNGGFLVEPKSIVGGRPIDSSIPDGDSQKEVGGGRGSGLQVDRVFLNYNYYYQMAKGWTQRASLKYTSDTKYRRNFPEDFLFKTYDYSLNQYKEQSFSTLR